MYHGPSWIMTVKRHHRVAVPDRRLLVDGTFVQALAKTLINILDELGVEVAGCQAQIEELAKQLEHPRSTEVPFATGGQLFLAWNYLEDEDDEDGGLNIGIGPAREDAKGKLRLADRDENRWIYFAPWDGSPARRTELEKLSKEELVDMLLRTEVVGR